MGPPNAKKLHGRGTLGPLLFVSSPPAKSKPAGHGARAVAGLSGVAERFRYIMATLTQTLGKPAKQRYPGDVYRDALVRGCTSSWRWALVAVGKSLSGPHIKWNYGAPNGRPRTSRRKRGNWGNWSKPGTRSKRPRDRGVKFSVGDG